jgi:alkyl hydroperoxide reductase subunit AhpC
MALRINDEAPNFDVETTQGSINFHEWIGDSWTILFSHPKDFTPICTTELGYMPADTGDTSEGRTAADNATARSVFVIGPDKKIKATLTYPMSTGRNFDEILRLLDSCQLTAKEQVATPVNWQQGDDVVILPAISDEDAKRKYPEGWKSPLPYIRVVPQPN